MPQPRLHPLPPPLPSRIRVSSCPAPSTPPLTWPPTPSGRSEDRQGTVHAPAPPARIAGGSRHASGVPMSQTPEDARISQIATAWTMLRQAHGPADEARDARALLVARYRGAAYRYLLKAVG